LKRLENRPSRSAQPTALAAALVLVGLMAVVIVSLSHPLSAAEPGKCTGGDKLFGGFLLLDPPHPVTAKPFFDARGGQRRLSDHRGRGVVFNFWATWCAPCIREMPDLDRLKTLVAGDDVDVLALSEDSKGLSRVENFYKFADIKNLEILLDDKGGILRDSRVRGLPTTLLINADGMEVARVQGVAVWDSRDVVAFIRRCLGNENRGK
jgi:thiol-disulfide isomerase/thioredoxin